MSLSRAEVEQVAALARLQFSDVEFDQLTIELGQIVNYVELLGQLETGDVRPMPHGVEQFNVFAADQDRCGLQRDDALANAPKSDRECYHVPAVLGD